MFGRSVKDKMVKLDLQNMIFEWEDSVGCSQVKEVLATLEEMNIALERVKSANKIVEEQQREFIRKARESK
jgi:hypothetical protein